MSPVGLEHPPRSSPPLRHRLVRIGLPLVSMVVLGAVLVFDVAPLGLFRDQGERIDAAEAELERLDVEVAALSARADELRDPDAVELMARDQFLLTRPDDELYVIRPPRRAPVAWPAGWPFPGLARALDPG